MKEQGYLTESSIVGGTSGGSLGAAIACSGIPTQEALEFLINASQNKAFKKNINKGLKESLADFLPPSTLERCNGRLHVCVTKVWPNPSGKVTIINKFQSMDELLEVLAASCFIPLYSAPAMVTKIGAEYFVDGGVFAFIPPVGEVRVSPIPLPAFRQARRSHIHIISRKYSLPQLVSFVLLPPAPGVLRDIYSEGMKAAELWIRREEIKSKLAVYKGET